MAGVLERCYPLKTYALTHPAHFHGHTQSVLWSITRRKVDVNETELNIISVVSVWNEDEKHKKQGGIKTSSWFCCLKVCPSSFCHFLLRKTETLRTFRPTKLVFLRFVPPHPRLRDVWAPERLQGEQLSCMPGGCKHFLTLVWHHNTAEGRRI